VPASVSQIFFFKSNAPSFSSFFIILLSFPLGRLSDRFFPESLVPGPFGKKEHLLVRRSSSLVLPAHFVR